jgi:RNA polymerase primary sigma factor
VASWNRLSTLRSLQAGIKKHRQALEGSRQSREIDTDISFNFSPEAMEAVQVIQDARAQEQHRKELRAARPRRNRLETEEAELQAMLGVDNLSLPYRTNSATWRRLESMLTSDDDQAKQQAKQAIVEHCLRKIYASAKSTLQEEEIDSDELSIKDVFQSTVCELCEVLDQYDPKQKMTLEQKISSTIYRNPRVEAARRGLIQLPQAFYTDIAQLKKTEAKIVQEQGWGAVTPPDPHLMAEYGHTYPEQVENLWRTRDTLGNEALVPLEDAGELTDEKTDIIEGIADFAVRAALDEALETLSYRERRVLQLRYGVGGEQAWTLDEVAREFNVNRERIRQIENQSIKKMQRLPGVAGYNQARPTQVRSKRLQELLSATAKVRAQDSIMRGSSMWGSPTLQYLTSIATLALHSLESGTSRRGSRSMPTAWFMHDLAGYVYDATGRRITSDDGEKAVTLLNKAGLLRHTWSKHPAQDSLPSDYVEINDPGVRRTR